MKNYLTSLLLLISITKVQAWAADFSPSSGPRFGPEFTFMSFGGHNVTSGLAQYLLNLEAHLIDGQPEGQKFKLLLQANANPLYPAGRNKYESPNGWAFHAKSDQGVIEVTMPPMSVEDYEQYGTDIQDAIFQTAYNLNFFAALYAGGGHINIDTSYFIDKPLLLRNFIVDLLNRNELSLGVFNYDTNNAISTELLSQHTIKVIKSIINKLDDGPLTMSRVYVFIGELHSALSNSSDPYMGMWEDFATMTRNKMTAFHLGYVGDLSRDSNRIELRAVRAQKDIDTWVRQIRLIRGRIYYLETLTEPIPYNPSFELSHIRAQDIDRLSAEEHKLKPPVDPQEALKAFHQYVTESGENIEDHLDYVWPQWITDGEVEKFKKGLCNSVFSGEAS